jgi:amidase
MRILGFAGLILLGAGALVAAAWWTGAVDRLLVDRFVRRPSGENLTRQLDTPQEYPGRREPDFSPFAARIAELTEDRARELHARIDGATIPRLQVLFERGELSAEELTLYFLARIERYDGRLHSVTELDPGALETGRRLDAERAAKGRRGPLHGIPVLLKDNIATRGPLHTTGGAKALEGATADRDAFLVARLREAGAVVLGKTALSEWANYMSTRLPNGFSAVGGQVRNPYGPFDVSGSSSGSAVAVAAGFATVAVGTETWGSLVSPASQNSVVAIKPSVGLVSRDRIIPIIRARDTAGPLARNVTDAAILLDVLAAADAADPASARAPKPDEPFAAALDPNGLGGRRVAVLSLRGEAAEGDGEMLARAVAVLERAGAAIVEQAGVSLLDVRAERDDFFVLARYDFKRGLEDYFAATHAPVKSLRDVIAFNSADPESRAPFGQDLLVGAWESETGDAEYAETLARSGARARRAVDALLDESGADLLVAIGSPFYVGYAAAGYPAVSVPAGYRSSGEPVGLAFVSRFLDELALIRAAFAFEQQARARRAPTLRP